MTYQPPGDLGVDDDTRLAALAAFGILDTPPERGFDDIVHLARRLCDAPVALVSLVERDRQWFKARAGFPPCETDLDRSVCKFVLAEPGPLIIPDLTADPRTLGNPLVTDEPHLRFYAGAPLRSPEGHVLGSLCVIDHAPRPEGLTPAQVEDLEALARQVMDQLVLRRALAERDEAMADQRRFLAQRATLIETQGAVTAAEGDLDAVLATLVSGALRAVPAADGAAIELREGDELVYRGVAGTLSGHADTRLPIEDSLAGACLRSGEPILCPDVRLDPRVNSDVAAALGLRSCILLPVTRGPEVAGVHKLQSAAPGAFSERDLYAALTFAGSLSAGLAQAGEADARRVASESERLLGLERGLLRAVLQQAPVGISIAHAGGGALLNDRMVEMLGHGVGGSDDTRYEGYGAVHPDGRPYAVMDYPTMRALRRDETVDGEPLRYRNAVTGEVREWRAHSTPVLGPGGETLAAVSVFIDVEDQRRTAEESGRLAAIVEHSVDFIGIAQPDGTAAYVNGAGRRLVGLPDLDAARQANLVEYFALGERERVLTEVLPTVEREGFWEGETRFRRFDDGVEVPVLYNIFPVRDADGGLLGYGTVTRDLSERKRAEAALQASDASLRAVLDTVPVGILIAEAPSGRIVGGNRRLEELLRHPVLPSPDADAYGDWVAFHADGRRVDPGEYPLARVIRDGVDRAELECEYRRGDGTTAWIAITGAPMRDEGSRTVGGVVAVADVDARRRAEAHQSLLNHELSHRMKNMFALVQAIASSTLRGTADIGTAREVLAGRLVALGKAHDVLLGGSAERAPLGAIVSEGVAAQEADGRIAYRGPDVEIGGKAALSLTLMLHELTTNAVKYGALSVPGGRVGVRADLVDAEGGPNLRIDWTESGGPPVVPPTRKGFGSRLIERGLSAQVEGTLRMDYAREGLRCVVEAPLANFQATG